MSKNINKVRISLQRTTLLYLCDRGCLLLLGTLSYIGMTGIYSFHAPDSTSGINFGLVGMFTPRCGNICPFLLRHDFEKKV
jgi:hypothetical protein